MAGLFLMLPGCQQQQMDFSPDDQERQAIERHPGFAIRDGRTLAINIGRDVARPIAVKRYVNSPSCDSYDECISFTLHDIDPVSRTIVLWQWYYEGFDALLLDQASGKEMELEYPPSQSPGHSFWAMVDEDVGYGSGKIQVIEHTEAGFAVVAEGFGNGRCSFQEWRSDQAFTILCSDPTSGHSFSDELLISQTETGMWAEQATGRRVAVARP